jgi:hypothetical protein
MATLPDDRVVAAVSPDPEGWQHPEKPLMDKEHDMIRIEGIPVVTARLAAARKSTIVTQTARPVRQPRMRQHLFPTPSKTVRGRRPPATAQVCA